MMHCSNIVLSDLLHSQRTAAGLSVRQLATLSGVSKSYISALENQRVKSPSRYQLDKIAAALSVPRVYLYLEAGVCGSEMLIESADPSEVSLSKDELQLVDVFVQRLVASRGRRGVSRE